MRPLPPVASHPAAASRSRAGRRPPPVDALEVQEVDAQRSQGAAPRHAQPRRHARAVAGQPVPQAPLRVLLLDVERGPVVLLPLRAASGRRAEGGAAQPSGEALLRPPSHHPARHQQHGVEICTAWRSARRGDLHTQVPPSHAAGSRQTGRRAAGSSTWGTHVHLPVLLHAPHLLLVHAQAALRLRHLLLARLRRRAREDPGCSGSGPQPAPGSNEAVPRRLGPTR